MTTGLDPLTRIDTTPSVVAFGVNVKSLAYGAVGDGTTDDTAAIQAAIDAVITLGGGFVYFPRGTYKVTGIVVDGSFVRLKGEGWASRIAMANATGDTLLFDNGATGLTTAEDASYLTGCGAEDLRLEPSVTRTSGCEIKAMRFNKLHLDRLVINNAYQGIQMGRSTDLCITAYINDLRMRTYFLGVKSQRVIEMWGSGWALDTNNVTAGATGIRLAGGNEGWCLTNFDVVNSHASATWGTLTTDVYTFHIKNDGAPTQDRFNKFDNGYFDSHSVAGLFEDGADNNFINVFWQSYKDEGIRVTGTTQNCKWIGGGAFRCGTDGVYHDSEGRGNQFINFSNINNNINGATEPRGYGFNIVAPAVLPAWDIGYVDIINCKVGRDDGGTTAPGFVGNMLNSVRIGDDVTNVLVRDCDLNFWAGCVNGAYKIFATSETNQFLNNKTEFGVGDYCRVYNSTALVIPPTTPTNLLFDTDRSDPNTMHDTASNTERLVGHTQGMYESKLTFQWSGGGGAGNLQISFLRFNAGGGGAIAFAAPQISLVTGSPAIHTVVCPEFFMLAEQYVVIQLVNNGSTNVTLAANPAWSPEATLRKVA